MTVAVCKRPVCVTVSIVLFLVAGCGKRVPGEVDLPRPSEIEPVQRVGGAETQLDREWFQDETLEVAKGVFVLGELKPSAAYAIRTSDGVILVDSGGEENCDVLRESLLQCGIGIDEIRYVLLTHAHYDHVFGANRIKDLTDAQIVAGRNEVSVLKSLDHYGIYSLFAPTPYSNGPIEVDMPVDGDETITCGDTSVSVIAAPGHTAGSTCYLLQRDGQRILFSGDVVASLNLGPATYSVDISPRYRGNATDYLATIDKLLEMKPPDLLLPGHPRQQIQRNTIALPARQWRHLLNHSRTELQQVVDQHAADGKDFLDGTPCQVEPDLFYFGDLDSIAVYGINSPQGLVVINSPGGEGFKDFLTAAMKKFGLGEQPVVGVLLTSTEPRFYDGVRSLTQSPHVFAADVFANGQQGKDSGIENLVSHKQLPQHLASFGESIEAVEFKDHIGSAVAYKFSLGEKQIVATPNVPRNIALIWTNRETGRFFPSSLYPQSEQLVDELRKTETAPKQYGDAIQAVEAMSPDVWLPAVPMTGQNANLYGDRWSNIIKANIAQSAKFNSQDEDANPVR